jgi:hypothetical protein
MGSPMQCNIKGLLCTLLYQLLQQDEDGTWIAELFRRNPSLKSKEWDSNWSEAELKKTLSMTLHLTAASHKICLFLDGLDEVHQSDGKHKLLILLEWLKAIGAVKLCVSSRPEEEFNQGLSSAWILNLHDLTTVDMYQYALDLLVPLVSSFSESVPRKEAYSYSKALQKRYYTNTPQTLAKTIISKSDGVFLWADLATRSLQRGITYGDTWSTMQQRLDLMPPGLSELYASMWSRPGEDARLYRAEAALCFNLVLDWELCSSDNSYKCWNPNHPPGTRPLGADADSDCRLTNCRLVYSPIGQLGSPISLFQLTLAKNNVLRADLSVRHESATELLWKECCRFRKRLPVLCAGLLEIKGLLSRVDDVGHEIRNPDIPVRFIHRTVKEFFTDTVEGRDILSSDTSSLEKRMSALLRASYSRALAFRSSGPGRKEILCLPVAFFRVASLAEKFRSLRSRLERREWLEELDAFQAFHDGGVGISTWHLDFLGLSIKYGYKEYLEYVFNDPSRYTAEYKSYLLVCASSIMFEKMYLSILAGKGSVSWDAEQWNTQDLTGWLAIVNFLLSQGCKSELVVVINDSGHFRITGLEAFFWSLSTIRRRINWTNDPVPCDRIMDTLRRFSESGADFTQHVYGYYGRDSLFSISHPYDSLPIIFGPGSPGKQNGVTDPRQVVVEISIFGALTRATKMCHRDDYFSCQMRDFLTTIKLDTNCFNPRIIAVRHPYNPNEDPFSQAEDRKLPGSWMEKAKRISGKHEEQLMNNISQWISQNDDNATTKMEKLDDELKKIVSSILDDRDVPEGVFRYFLELGFLESGPRFLAHELQYMGFARQTDEDGKRRFLNGVIYPPVKYVDQIK